MIYFFPQVNQRNVPGIDNAYLAMDTEEGVEVVWNEVMFSERKNFKLQEVRLNHQESVCVCVRKIRLMTELKYRVCRQGINSKVALGKKNL